MKLRKALKRFTSLALICLLVLSLVACAKDDSDSDDDKAESDKTDTTKVVMDVDSLLEKMTEKTTEVMSEDKIKELTEDGYITYEEVSSILKELPSSKFEFEFCLDMAFDATDGEFSESESLEMLLDVVIEYDSKTQSIHMGMNADSPEGTESSDMWMINEDGTYYGYETFSGNDVAYREELGNLEELFGEKGIAVEDIEEGFEDMLSEYSDLLDSSSDLYSADTMNDFSDSYTLADGFVKFNGEDCYNLVMSFDYNKYIDLIKENEEYQNLLEEMDISMDDIDELLSMELSEGMTVKDILDYIKFDMNYYITKDFMFTGMKCDFSGCCNNLFDFLEDYVLTMVEDTDTEVSMDLICNDAYFIITCDYDADVNVVFEGEYEEYDDYDVYDSIEVETQRINDLY